MSASRPEPASPAARVGVFGPLLGSNEGRVISQGEVLVRLLEASGMQVVSASSRPERAARAVDTVLTAVRSAKSLDAAVIEVYSGPAFRMAELTSLTLRPFRVPTVLVLHGGNLPDFAARRPTRVARLLSGAEAVVCPSPFLARELDKFAAIEVVPNALPMASYPARTRSRVKPRLLWMRAFHPLYRPELALQVLAELRRDTPDATLTMAGADKGLLAATRRRAVDLGVADAVTFPGFLDPDAKAAALADHDVYLSTNAVDNTPVAVLEACASGLIVIAMAVGGIPDLIIDGQSGLLVPDGDSNVMAGAVRHVLGDEAAASRLSLAAQVLGATSTHSAVTSAWEGVLSRVTGSGRAARSDTASGESSVRVRVRAARVSDLARIADVHTHSFPDSALTALGRGAVERYYRWLLLGPHDAYNVVAEDGHGALAGFVFSGTFRGALTGFVRRHVLYLVVQVMTRPRLWRVPEVRDRARTAIRLIGRRHRTSSSARAPSTDRFGVLAIAVDPEAQGRGFGALLLEDVAREAAHRGASTMSLTVHPSNSAAIAFYERLGWQHDRGHATSMSIDVEAGLAHG